MSLSSLQFHPFWIRSGKPCVLLAPMEGVIDRPMRTFLTEFEGIDCCVSEFLRISQDIPPKRVFLEHSPELENQGRTPTGVPVQIQILGGNAEKLAEAAARACAAGAWGIDLNFGCPAPTVNRHDGGASLLRFPRRIREIVEAVRKVVPAELPVSAKLRLGWESIQDIHENADRAAEGGASWIIIHGRTKVQGYSLPVYWKPIGEVQKRLSGARGIPIVANGEIGSVEALRRCQDETGCEHFMIGRAALADVYLAGAIRRELGGTTAAGGVAVPAIDGMNFQKALSAQESGWSCDRTSIEYWRPLFARFAVICNQYGMGDGYILRRMKQWAGMAHAGGRFSWFDAFKRTSSLQELRSLGFAALPEASSEST